MELVNNYCSDVPNRKRIEPVDFISNLPDPLILHILSFLHGRDTIRTIILSKRWQDLWAYSPTLNFYIEDNDEDENLRRFLSFVNCTLLSHRSPKIDKLDIETYCKKSFANDIDAWILFAKRKGVHELRLYNCNDDEYGDEDDKYVLPSYIFNFPCLVTLNIYCCLFEGHKGLNWKSLRELSLSSMALSNNLIRDILSASPVLESLKIWFCKDFDYIDIKSKKLAKLDIMNLETHELNAGGLKISAPYLRSLQISGSLNLHIVSLENTSESLVDATIAYAMKCILGDLERSREMFTKSMKDLVQKLRHVKNLNIGHSCFQVLSMTLMENGQLCPFLNLACLRIYTSLEQDELHALIRLLLLTHNLDTLVLCMTPSCSSRIAKQLESLNSLGVNAESIRASEENVLAVTSLNLKNVKIVDFDGTEREMEFIALMLKSVGRLEKMIIQKRSGGLCARPRRNFPPLEGSTLFMLTQRLLSFPRCSADAVVLFS